MRYASKTSDADRIRLATRKGGRMLGPAEYQRCGYHPTHWEAYRWTWDADADPTSGTTEAVRSCNHPEHDD